MRVPKRIKILTLVILGVLILPAFISTNPTSKSQQVMASYNPAPANNFHAPLSSMALIGVTGATPNVQSSTASASQSTSPSNQKSVQQNALRFITDNSYFPQTETSIAVDPNNPDHVVGGFNDQKFFFCPALPQDCTPPAPASISGFTTSTDGGKTVAKSSDIPGINVTGAFLTAFGDPSVAAAVDGNFFYASLAINPSIGIFGNAIMIAKSNSNLFDPNISCVTTVSDPANNPCWKAIFVYGHPKFPVFTVEDKDRIAVDRDPSSPFYGSVYVGWDHFFPSGISASFLARCDGNLNGCTIISDGNGPVLSGQDLFVAWTTPTVDKNGNVHVAFCNFGTFTTFGPVNCRVASAPPGGASFSPPVNMLSYMGTGTDLPTDTVVLGWATEQFRVGIGLISIAVDLSSKSSNLYFTTQVCTSGHYDAFSSQIAFGVAADNPGDCGQSAVLLSRSTDNGQSWSSPITLSHPAVNDQPFVTVDPENGIVTDVYYTTQYDEFNHRIDVVASISDNAGQAFHQQRITSVSNEPNSDPNMYDYVLGNGFGGSFTVPQYGDYFEATATGGNLWVLFTANYAVEEGTFQTDPFLITIRQNG